MQPRIYLLGKSFRYEEIKLYKVAHKEPPFVHSAIHFIKEWLSGQSTFRQNTSGSTGIPKAITLTREQMKASAQATVKALGLKPGSKTLLCINPDFIGGKMMMVRALEGKFDLTIIPPVSDPSAHLSGDVTFDFGAFVPLQVKKLLETKKGQSLVNAIKKIIIGGAAIDRSLGEKLQNATTDIYHTYGMTETVSHIALKKLNGTNRFPYFKVLDDIEMKTDMRSCLMIKGAVTNHHWVTTNDVVTVIDYRHFDWLGRHDLIINSGGIKVLIEPLEAEIKRVLGHTLTQNFIVIGLPDPTYGEKIVLVTEGKSVHTKEQWVQKLKATPLPKYHLPKEVIQLEQFPQTGSGKVDREKINKIIREGV